MSTIEAMFFGFLWGVIFAGVVALFIFLAVWAPLKIDKKRPYIPPVTPWTR